MVNKSQVAELALQQISAVYDIEPEVRELAPDERQRIRLSRSRPVVDALHQWLRLTRQKVTHGTATAKAIDYSLKRGRRGLASSMMGCCPWIRQGHRTGLRRGPHYR